jgi:hypothetical protein
MCRLKSSLTKMVPRIVTHAVNTDDRYAENDLNDTHRKSTIVLRGTMIAAATRPGSGSSLRNMRGASFIESKVLVSLRAAQIESHRRTAARRGFTTVIAVAITQRAVVALRHTVMLEWRDIYAWLRRHSADSIWAGRVAGYLEIAEAKLIETGQFAEGTLTMFSGFPFDRDHPYAYLEGKRVLGLREYPGVAPWFRGQQRRWSSLKAIPYLDALIEFDLRTAGEGSKGPQPQLRWLEAGYGSFVNKERSNYAIQLGAIFRYERCPELRRPDATDLIARAWLACEPLVDLGRR